MRPLPLGSDAQRQTLESDGKSAGARLRESTSSRASIAEFLSSSACFRETLQLLGAAYAAPHQDQPAKPSGYPDDHPNRRDGRQTEHQADQQRLRRRRRTRVRLRRACGLRRITSRNSSIRASSRSICSAGVGSASNIELSGGIARRSDPETCSGPPRKSASQREADRYAELKMTFPSQSIACPRRVDPPRSAHRSSSLAPNVSDAGIPAVRREGGGRRLRRRSRTSRRVTVGRRRRHNFMTLDCGSAYVVEVRTTNRAE